MASKRKRRAKCIDILAGRKAARTRTLMAMARAAKPGETDHAARERARARKLVHDAFGVTS